MAGCKTKKCGCEDYGLTTPTPCIHDAPNCPDPSKCSETFDSDCILYNGVGSTCLEVTPGDTVQDVLDTIMTSLSTLKCLTCISTVIPSNGTGEIGLTPTLSWGASPGATMYDLYFGTDSNNLVLISTGQAGTTYTFTNMLSSAEQYYWKVVARNDSGSSGTDCPVFTFTTIGVDCLNPLVFILNDALAVSEEGSLTIAQALTETLTIGLISSTCDSCCPDCTETQRYFIGGITPFSTYFQAVYSETCPPPCCINKILTLSEDITYQNLYDDIDFPPVCCTNLGTCYTDLTTYLSYVLGPDSLGTIIEESTIDSSSLLCVLQQWAEDNSIPLSDTLLIWGVLQGGVVIHCTPQGTVIASSNSYVDWYEATGQTCYNL